MIEAIANPVAGQSPEMDFRRINLRGSRWPRTTTFPAAVTER